ncbi:unnamed protein product, partial [Ectocarpus sp. 4 AP-2014]
MIASLLPHHWLSGPKLKNTARTSQKPQTKNQNPSLASQHLERRLKASLLPLLHCLSRPKRKITARTSVSKTANNIKAVVGPRARTKQPLFSSLLLLTLCMISWLKF